MSLSQKENQNKPTLPHGWIVRQSKSYPDRVYYFNIDTGVSTWEIPKLIKDKVTGSAPRMTLPGQTSHLLENQSETQIEDAQFSPEPDTESEEDEEREIRVSRWDISSPTASANPDMKFSFKSNLSHFQAKKIQTPSFESVKSPPPLPTSASKIITSPSAYVKVASAGNSHEESKGNVRSVMNDKIKRQVTGDRYESFHNVNKTMRENDKGRRVQNSPPYKKSKVEHSKVTKLINQPLGKDLHVSKSGTKRKTDSNSKVSDPCLDKRTVLSYDNEYANSKRKRIESVPSTSDSKSVRRKSSSFHIEGEVMKLDSAVDGDKRKVHVVSKSKDQNNFINVSDHSPAVRSQISSKKSEPMLKKTVLQENALSLKVKVFHKTSVSSHSSFSSTDRRLVTTSPVVSENSKECNVVIFPQLGENNCFRDEKLKIIQSWIDNLQPEPASSPNHSVESQPGVSTANPIIESTAGAGKSEIPFFSVESNDRRVVITHDAIKSGGKKYLQQQIEGRRGWPGKVVPGPKMVERQISEMEVDDIPLPETLLETSAQEEDMIVDVVLSEVREQLRNHPEQVVGSLTQSLCSGGATVCQTADEMRTTSLYIVIDTNVFMDHLSFISDLKDQVLEGFGRPILIIPWIVLQELDSLKGDGGNSKKGIPNLSLQTQRKARKPVQFLNNVFQAKHPCIVGQTPKESSEAAQVFKAECNDDRILQCCMQCQKKYINSEIVLLTNDKNLVNKAFACKIPAFSRQIFHDGIRKLVKKNIQIKAPLERANAPLKSPDNEQVVSTSLPQPHLIAQTESPSRDFQYHQPQQQDSKVRLNGLVDEIFCLLKTQMKSVLGHVLEVEMKEAFGDMWLTIVLKKPPWSLLDILECFKKHWRAVFGFVFNRKLEDVVHKIVQRFSVEKGCIQSMEILEELLVEVLLLFEGCQQHSSYKGLVTGAVVKLRILQKLCSDVLDNNANLSTLPSLDVYLEQKICSHQSTPLLTPGSTHKQVNVNQLSEIRDDHQASAPSSLTETANQTIPYPISVATTSITTQGSSEIGIKKFHQIWEAIHHCCAVLDKFHKDWTTNPSMDPEESKEAFFLLSNLVPAVRDLHREFSVISSLPPAAIYQHPQAVTSMCTHLNTFFSRMQAEDPEEPVAEIHLATLFSQEDKRPILQSGMEQLDSFIRQIYLYVKALPDT